MNPLDPLHWTLNSCFAVFRTIGCIWDHLVALRNSVQNGPNWCKSSCHEVASEFFTTNAPNPPHWTLNSCFVCFVQFWCICGHLDELRNSVKNGPNWYKSSWYKDASKFYEVNTPDPSHWTLNSFSGAFRTILVHWGPFG